MFFVDKALKLMATYEVGCKQVAQARTVIRTTHSAYAFDQWLVLHILDMADDILEEAGVSEAEAMKVAEVSVLARQDAIKDRIAGWGDSTTAAIVTYFQVRADFAGDEKSWNLLLEILDEEVLDRAKV